MALLLNFESGGDSDEPIGDNGGVEYGIAQSFTMPGSDATIGSVTIYVKKVNTITDPITLTIETNNGTVPSGTLVNANATGTFALSNTSYDWHGPVFGGTFALSASTKYWIKCVVPAQSTNNRYEWQRDMGNGYADGGESVKADAGAWAGEIGTQDMYFRVYSYESSGATLDLTSKSW